MCRSWKAPSPEDKRDALIDAGLLAACAVVLAMSTCSSCAVATASYALVSEAAAIPPEAVAYLGRVISAAVDLVGAIAALLL